MVEASKGVHHFHLRKRIHKNFEEYPHPDKFKNFIDKIIYFVGIFGPIMTIPQVLQIWYYKTAVGVSLISWIAYLFCAIIWAIYGFLHKEKPIIVSQCFYIVLEIFIVIGIILYG